MKKIAIIGAGITGITTAYFLAKQGYAVTVYDKHRYSAMQTSYANGGQLSVSNSEVWNTPATLLKGLRWMFKKDAPLLVNPTLSWGKVKWMSSFLWNTFNGSSSGNTQKTIELGLQARELYYQIADLEGIPFDLLKEGILHIYKNEQYLQAAETSCNTFKQMGVDRHMVTTSEILKLEPALVGSSGIVGGTFTPDDASGDIHKFCTNLSTVLHDKYGVRFLYDHEVTDLIPSINSVTVFTSSEIATSSIAFDQVVVCAGVDSPNMARLIGESLNIYPVKGYSITVNLADSDLSHAPVVSLLDEETKIVTSRLGNKLRVAGTAELAGFNYDIRSDRIKPLVNWVRDNFPGINSQDIKPWAGLRPMTPNMVPIVRPSSKSPRVLLNTGHGHLGWTLAPATAIEILNFLL